jgi:hypothetical protein
VAVRLKEPADVVHAVGLPAQWRQASAYTGLKLTIHVEVSESGSCVSAATVRHRARFEERAACVRSVNPKNCTRDSLQ